MANAERLKAVREAILAHPDQWNQTTWVRATPCGTTLCVAGWACTLAGRTPDLQVRERTVAGSWVSIVNDAIITGTLLATPEEKEANPDGVVFISDFAREWLELDTDEASELFFSAEETTLPLIDRLIAEAEESNEED